MKPVNTTSSLQSRLFTFLLPCHFFELPDDPSSAFASNVFLQWYESSHRTEGEQQDIDGDVPVYVCRPFGFY